MEWLLESSNPSMSCRGFGRWVKNRLGKGKLQRDLAFVVGHFEDCIQHARLAAFGFEQLPDRRPRDLPGVIGIAQLFALGVENQLFSDAGIEVIFWH